MSSLSLRLFAKRFFTQDGFPEDATMKICHLLARHGLAASILGRRTRAVAMPRHHSRCDDYPCTQCYLEQRDLGSVEASSGATWITAMANSLR